MDELERLLEEYIQAEEESSRTVTVKAMRNAVAPRLVEKGIPVSEVLRGVAVFVKQKVNEGTLFREGSGVYSYWSDGVPDDLRVSYSQREVEVLEPPRPPVADAPDTRSPAFSAFESVASLAASDQFLIKRDIKKVDLQALQGFSL